MGLLALLPAVGAAAIWLPAAIYLLVTGSIWQGVVLLLFGASWNSFHAARTTSAVTNGSKTILSPHEGDV
jgi:hypothetical protein